MISVFDGFGWMCDGFFRILLDPGGFCWIFLEGFFGFKKKGFCWIFEGFFWASAGFFRDSLDSLKDSVGSTMDSFSS